MQKNTAVVRRLVLRLVVRLVVQLVLVPLLSGRVIPQGEIKMEKEMLGIKIEKTLL